MTRATAERGTRGQGALATSNRPVAGSGRISRGNGCLALLARYFSSWHFLHTVAANVRAGEEVLDFGCGGGNAFVPSRFHATGVDVDFDSVRTISGFYQRAVNGDSSQLPFRSESFDAVVSSFVLEHLPFESATSSLSEVRRVLRRDGVLICICDLECNHPMLSILRRLSPEGYRQAFVEVPGHWGLRREAAWVELLERAGFDIVEWRLMSRFPILDHAAWTYLAAAPRMPAAVRWAGQLANRVNRWGRVADVCNLAVVVADDLLRAVLPRSWAYRLLFVARKGGAGRSRSA